MSASHVASFCFRCDSTRQMAAAPSGVPTTRGWIPSHHSRSLARWLGACLLTSLANDDDETGDSVQAA